MTKENNYVKELYNPKWIDIKQKLPDNDRTVLVWIEDKQNFQWSNYALGTYQNEKWYLQNGRDSHEIVTHWSEIPEKR